MSMTNRSARRVRTSVRLAYVGVIHDLEGEAQTIDLSVKGCRASCQLPPPVGTKLQMSIYLPDMEQGLSIELAIVRWVKQPMMGIQFHSVSSPHRERLQQWILNAPYGQSQGNRTTPHPGAIQGMMGRELPQRMKATPVSLASALSRTQTIFVVDDEQAIVQLCDTILRQAGFSVLMATKSSEALRMCKEHPESIHLLLTDVVMHPPDFSLAIDDNEFPHIHGYELAVRAVRLRNDLRVILMSGPHIDQELAGYGITRRTLPALLKPFTVQGLVTLVRETLQGPPPSIKSLTTEPAAKLLRRRWVVRLMAAQYESRGSRLR